MLGTHIMHKALGTSDLQQLLTELATFEKAVVSEQTLHARVVVIISFKTKKETQEYVHKTGCLLPTGSAGRSVK